MRLAASIGLIALLHVSGEAGTQRNAKSSAIVHLSRNDSEGWLLGGTTRKRWQDQEAAVKSMDSRAPYRVYDSSGLVGEFRGSAPRKGEDPPDSDQYYVRLTGLPERHGDLVALQGRWNAQPRRIKSLSTGNKVYQDVARKFLLKHGVANARPTILQLLRIDLDGDGEEEVLLHARGGLTDPPSPRVDAGAYCFVLLRQLHQGKVKEMLLAGGAYPKSDPLDASTMSLPTVHRIVGCVDTDGDGSMEILVETRYYEGSSVSVYSLSAGKVRLRLEAGVGV